MIKVINKYSCLPFDYGKDCCQFAGDVIESITGKNPMRQFSYETEDDAYEIINKYGDLEGAMRHVLGEPYDGHKDGDVCLINSGDGRLAAAVIHKDEIIARVPGGLKKLPLSSALLVWRT